MNAQLPLKSVTLMASAVLVSGSVFAGVKTLSSDEMTETYIKDSTIIVTPAQQSEQKTKTRKLATLTISPGEAEKSEAEKQADFEQILSNTNSQLGDAVTFAEIEAEQQNLLRQAQISIAPTGDDTLIRPERPLPNIPGFKEFIESGVLQTNFDYTPLLGGAGVELQRVDNQLIMSFGNLRGVDTIQMPQAITEGPVQLAPRAGGGFDMIIDIPQQGQ